MSTARERADAAALRQIDEDRLYRAGAPDWMAPVDTWQEHCDHVAGCASEQQNAFALSQMQFDSGMRKVRALTDAGRFVVVTESTAYCRFTDATIGTNYHVESDHATREEADAAIAAMAAKWGDLWAMGDCDTRVYPLPIRAKLLPSVPAFDGDDDIPF